MNCSLFKPLVIFFDMTNSLAIFQTMMNNIYKDFITKDIMIVYLNHILIFIWTLAEYYWTVCRVLEILTEYKLFFCPEKYEFSRPYIKYLSLIIWSSQNKPCQSSQSSWLVYTNKLYGVSSVSWLHQLLFIVHPGLFWHS